MADHFEVLKPEDIPFMEWGVVNRYNYEGRLHEIPVKAFDDIYVPCRNPAGRYAINSSVRRKRHKKLRDFSSLFKGEDYIVISIDGKYHRDPLRGARKGEDRWQGSDVYK